MQLEEKQKLIKIEYQFLVFLGHQIISLALSAKQNVQVIEDQIIL